MCVPARSISHERMLWKLICGGWRGFEKPLHEAEHLTAERVVLGSHWYRDRFQ